MKKLLAIFLLVIICTQCLPVMELGKCFYNSSYVEDDTNFDGVDKKEIKDFCSERYFCHSCFYANNIKLGSDFIRLQTELINGPIYDVTTPPPNA